MTKLLFRMIPVGPLGTNCYVVGCETTKKGLVIDPGDDADVILRHIRELGLDLGLIVATHAHFDHIAGLKKLKDASGAVFAIHPAEQGLLRTYTVPRAESFGFTFDTPPLPDKLVNDGDILELGELRLKVLHTPGHSPGGICLEGHGVVFSGATLFNYGIGRTDNPFASFEQLIDSIRTKLLVLPDATPVLPGHGPRTTIGQERRANPFLKGPAGFGF